MHSGTTLLLKMLSAHTMCFEIPGETRIGDYLEYFNRQWKSMVQQMGFVEAGLSLFKYSGLAAPQVQDILKNLENGAGSMPSSPSRVFNEVLKDLSKGKAYWLEKTPSNVYQGSNLLSEFPGSKLILIHRDGRAILASKKVRASTVDSERYRPDQLKLKRLEKDYNLLADGLAWRKSINNMLKLKEEFPSEVLLMKYEKLVQHPENEINRICDFLGLTYEEKMITISFSNPSVINQEQKEMIYKERVESWRWELEKREINFCEQWIGMQLEELGYQRVSAQSKLAKYWPVTGQLSGMVRRIYKRIRFFSGKDLIVYARNYLKR